MSRVALLATGGTIATRTSAAGRDVALGAAELLLTARVPAGVTVETVDAAGRLSFAATLDDLAALAGAVRRAGASNDGVVVTHGTDTLEETAVLLALTHDGATPVTLTGAQRPADHRAPDGPDNLAAALAWAAHGTPGVTVTFAGRVWPAVGVRKVHAAALAAFAAPGRGPLASVDEAGSDEAGSDEAGSGWGSASGSGSASDGAPRVRVHAVASVPALADPPPTLPRVDVVAQYVGADAHAIEAAAASGARGVVVAAFGAGNATPPVVDAARRLLERGVPVAVASRTGDGPVAGLYAGGGADLARAGALFAGDLSPWATRLLLAVAIAAHPDRPLEAARGWLTRAGVTS